MKVLLIERSRSEAEKVERTLHEAALGPFEITHAGSLPAALEILRQEPFDVALLSLPGPPSSGTEMVGKLAAAAPELPVVALVGPKSEELGEQAVKAGARDYLVKRATRQTLAARVLNHATEARKREHEREALEISLAESRARLSAILNAGSVGVAFTSLDGRVEDVNFPLEALLGFTRAELLTTSLWDLVVPEERASDQERVTDLIEGRAKYLDLDCSFLRRDGQTLVAITTISVIRDARQNPLQLAITLRDVTGRRRAEGALQQNLEESRAILDTASDAFITMNADGTIREWNPRAEHLFGWTRAEALGRTAADMIVPARLRRDHEDGMEGLGGTAELRVLGRPVEMTARQRDGTEFPAEITIWRSGSEDKVRFNAFLRDLSERKRANQALVLSELRFRALFDQSPMGIALQATDGRVIASNVALQRMLGFEGHELLGKTYADLAHPDDVASAPDIRAELLTGGKLTVQTERRCLRKDGEFVWLRVSASVVRDPDLNSEYFIAMSEDITDQRRSEATMREMTLRLLDLVGPATSEAKTYEDALRVALEHVCLHFGWQVGHVVWAAEERAGHAIPSDLWYFADAESFAGFRQVSMDVEEAPGSSLAERVLATGKPLWIADLGSDPLVLRGQAAAQAGIRSAFAFPIVVGEEPQAVMEFFSTARVERDTTLMDAMAQIGLKLGRIIERKRLEALLEHQAMHDSLTGLPNRALFLDRLKHALTRNQRNGERVAVLFLDLDDFKGVNDTYGHAIGDRLLTAVATRLRTLLRPADTITRHGGDEFTVLCEDIESEDQAEAVAQRILETLAEPIDLEGADLGVTASIGIALAAPGRETPEAVLANADAAMYRAKERGGGRIEQFDARLRNLTLKRRGIKAALRTALDRGQLRLLYQPSVSLADGRIRAVEALLRWAHPERGLLTPDEIIPAAEESGLIVPIGLWVIEEACRQAVAWRALGDDANAPFMSVNLSARQLYQPELPGQLADALARTGMDPGRLCLEITESVLMKDTETALRDLETLRSLGVDLGIDDFGTGYSSFGYLKRFRFSWLKIDRSFVRGVGTDPQDGAIVEAIIRLAHALRLTVVAEGVETEKQANDLRRMGCDWAQGFYYARPQPAAEIEQLVEAGGGW